MSEFKDVIWILACVFLFLYGWSCGRKQYYRACKGAIRQREMNAEVARGILEADELPVNIKIRTLKELFKK